MRLAREDTKLCLMSIAADEPAIVVPWPRSRAPYQRLTCATQTQFEGNCIAITLDCSWLRSERFSGAVACQRACMSLPETCALHTFFRQLANFTSWHTKTLTCY